VSEEDFRRLVVELERGDARRLERLCIAAAKQTGAGSAGRYPASIYNNGIAWGEDWAEELAQGMWENHLLINHGLTKLCTIANSLSEFEKLLFGVAKRELQRRRKRTVIDNLMPRIKEILSTMEVKEVQINGKAWWTSSLELGTSLQDFRGFHRWTPLVAQQFADEISGIPRDRLLDGRLNAAPIYSKQALERILTVALSSFQPFCLEDIRDILEKLLTFAVPSHLEFNAGDQLGSSGHWVGRELEIRELAEKIVVQLDEVEKWCLILQYQGLTMSEIAQYLTDVAQVQKISTRQTVSAKIDLAVEKIKKLIDADGADAEEDLVCEVLCLIELELLKVRDD